MNQLAIPLENSSALKWLGLVMPYEALFNSLQSEWLESDNHEFILAVNGFIEPSLKSTTVITTYIQLSLSDLPSVCVSVLRDGTWINVKVGDIQSSDRIVCWKGSIPAFLILKVLVASEDHASILKGFAKNVSNVPLPSVEPIEIQSLSLISMPQEPKTENIIHSGLKQAMFDDSVRGGLALAFNFVPRSLPWINLLIDSFFVSEASLHQLANNLSSPWLSYLPWSINTTKIEMSFNDALWTASINVLMKLNEENLRSDAFGVIKKILDEFQKNTTDYEYEISLWIQETTDLLKAKREIKVEDWRTLAVANALQLVLLRPDPTNFRKWADELELPLPTWWSGAILCGLWFGYKKLDVKLRGEDVLRKYLVYHFIASYPKRSNEPQLPKLEYAAKDGDIIIVWKGKEVWRKKESIRNKWFSLTQFNNEELAKAKSIASDLGWNCFSKKIFLNNENVHFNRKESAVVDIDLRADLIKIRGEVELFVPSHARVEDIFDTSLFRQCLLTDAGEVPSPKEEIGPYEIERFSAIPGLLYVSQIISQKEEQEIISMIDRLPWLDDLKRRTQHYGWKYDYRAKKIDESMKLGHLPQWASALSQRIFKSGLIPNLPDQVIVNEYIKSQIISKHIDCVTCFDDGIAMISLLEPWEMIFTNKKDKKKFAITLAPRSVLILTKEARYDWAHEIPKRSKEPSGHVRERRVSITFRKVIIQK